LRVRAHAEITDVVVSTPKQAAEYINAETAYWRSVAGK